MAKYVIKSLLVVAFCNSCNSVFIEDKNTKNAAISKYESVVTNSYRNHCDSIDSLLNDSFVVCIINFDTTLHYEVFCYDINDRKTSIVNRSISMFDTCYILYKNRFDDYELSDLEGNTFLFKCISNENQLLIVKEFVPPRIIYPSCVLMLPDSNELLSYGFREYNQNINKLISDIEKTKSVDLLLQLFNRYADISSASGSDEFSGLAFQILTYFDDNDIVFLFENMEINALRLVKETLFIAGYGLNPKANLLYFRTHNPMSLKKIMSIQDNE